MDPLNITKKVWLRRIDVVTVSGFARAYYPSEKAMISHLPAYVLIQEDLGDGRVNEDVIYKDNISLYSLTWYEREVRVTPEGMPVLDTPEIVDPHDYTLR